VNFSNQPKTDFQMPASALQRLQSTTFAKDRLIPVVKQSYKIQE
jgi:hypothetical protein